MYVLLFFLGIMSFFILRRKPVYAPLENLVNLSPRMLAKVIESNCKGFKQVSVAVQAGLTKLIKHPEVELV